MRALALLALLASALLFAEPAAADAMDDYVACMIGKAAVALNHQEIKNPERAILAAYRQCPEPMFPAAVEPDGVEDLIRRAVEGIAKELGK